MDAITLTLGPSPPAPPCRHCGEPAAVEVESARLKRPGGECRELLQVFPLYLCRACYPDNAGHYLRRMLNEPGSSLTILAVSLDVVVAGHGNPWLGTAESLTR